MRKEYLIVYNPDRLLFKHEIFMNYTLTDTVHGVTLTFDKCQHVASYRTQEKAEKKIQYWKDVNQFKGERG